MSGPQRIIQRARLCGERKAQRKQLRRQLTVHRSQFVLEPLEQRLLLSADAAPAALIGDLNGATGPAALTVTFESLDKTKPGPTEEATTRDNLTIAPLLLDSGIADSNSDTHTMAPSVTGVPAFLTNSATGSASEPKIPLSSPSTAAPASSIQITPTISWDVDSDGFWMSSLIGKIA